MMYEFTLSFIMSKIRTKTQIEKIRMLIDDSEFWLNSDPCLMISNYYLSTVETPTTTEK